MKTTRALALLATALFTAGFAGTANAITPVPFPAPGTGVTSSAPAAPATAPAAAQAEASLRLTVTHGRTPTSGTPHVAILDCPPDSVTTHPDPVTACRLLESVNGDLDQLNVNPGVCTDLYDPYTVTATGTYRGRPLSYQHTYGNHCVLLRTAGAFFDF
ncbi:SSI family serine proteinase inhibitor [Kitasatospora sp. NPDC002551]|uniref:SSI family serine proteinase inhibitor n=1 Tax=unclassified Kitasatospora TaxID=2633591 RepID=UPI00331FE0EF